MVLACNISRREVKQEFARGPVDWIGAREPGTMGHSLQTSMLYALTFLEGHTQTVFGNYDTPPSRESVY